MLTPERLTWTGDNEGSVAYRAVVRVKVYQTRFWGSSKSYWTCILYLDGGRKIHLGAAHRLRGRVIEDRTSTYIPFIKELEARVAAANVDARFVSGRGWLSRVESAAGWVAVKSLLMIRHLDRNRSADVLAKGARMFGPRWRGHRIARMQLKAAFPERNLEDIDKILDGMWDNLGRVIAEIAHLDRIRISHPDRLGSCDVMYEPPALARLHQIRQSEKPTIFFAAHVANWEIPALVPPLFGLDCHVLYRPPHIKAINDAVLRIRAGCMGNLIPAGLDAPIRLADVLKRGGHVGMLVDQHYARGVDVTFFRRTCKANPLLAQLARRFNCTVRGFRVVRLNDRNTFRGEVTEPLDLPRDIDGRIEIQGTMQTVTSVIEGWVQQHPEQWLWFHRRWR
jgi:KDO2-lipid IV(A) lauroyltransferase